MADRFARAVVGGRVAVVVAWIAAAAFMTVELPTLGEAQTDALGQLVPVDSPAVEAERLSVELFAFPLASRTLVVQRDPGGLPAERLALTARRIAQANGRGRLPVGRPPLGAYGITNAIPRLSFARERGTTALTAPVYAEDLNQEERVDAAKAYARTLRAPPGEFVGLTGVVPAQAEQADIIEDTLPRMELATLALVTLIVAAYLRSAVAPLATLLTVAVAYLVSIRAVAAAGERIGVSVPAEVEPIVVALLFGVVTDYSLFYLSRFRARLADGAGPRDAARRVTAELTPIILACGLAVAGAAAVLAVAQLGFLRAFGPGMAIAVLVGLAVTLTLLPALLALTGGRLFWPSSPRRPRQARSRRDPLERMLARAVRAPRRTIAACLAVLAVASAPLLWLELGNSVIGNLPAGSDAREASAQLTRGFAPGVVGPATLIVTAPGITERRRALARLQRLLAAQPGVAGVIGPATGAGRRPFGIVLSPTRDAARFFLIGADDPFGADAVRLFANLDARTAGLLDAVGLEGADALYAGDTAILRDIIDTANEDYLRVVPAALLAVGIVLALLLRALVAPAYLVLLAVLSPLAALGLAVAFFQGLLGQPELTFFVPLAAGVLLISLGSDYNIFLVGRIWSEARRRPLGEAVVAAGSGASHAISAAGLVLAGSFAALALVPLDVFAQLAFVLAAGLLIDAFLVRSVLTPAVISLVGERSAWPGPPLAASAPARASEPAPGEQAQGQRLRAASVQVSAATNATRRA
jgi:RND superfamily putative drug exporter